MLVGPITAQYKDGPNWIRTDLIAEFCNGVAKLFPLFPMHGGGGTPIRPGSPFWNGIVKEANIFDKSHHLISWQEFRDALVQARENMERKESGT